MCFRLLLSALLGLYMLVPVFAQDRPRTYDEAAAAVVRSATTVVDVGRAGPSTELVIVRLSLLSGEPGVLVEAVSAYSAEIEEMRGWLRFNPQLLRSFDRESVAVDQVIAVLRRGVSDLLILVDDRTAAMGIGASESGPRASFQACTDGLAAVASADRRHQALLGTLSSAGVVALTGCERKAAEEMRARLLTPDILALAHSNQALIGFMSAVNAQVSDLIGLSMAGDQPILYLVFSPGSEP